MKEITTSEITNAFQLLHLPLDVTSVHVVTGHLIIWLGYWNHQRKKQIRKKLKASVMAHVLTQSRGNTL